MRRVIGRVLWWFIVGYRQSLPPVEFDVPRMREIMQKYADTTSRPPEARK